MSFETKSKIEFACVVVGIVVLFAMPFMVMAAG